MYVIKKDGTHDLFNTGKIKEAISKSASRVMVDLSEEVKDSIAKSIEDRLIEEGNEAISIETMHNLVEGALEDFNPEVAKSYRDYRNYKQDFVHMMDEVFKASQHIRFIGDKENSNTDSTLVATKRCLVFNELNKRLYRKFFMTKDELQACKDGYIYVHDQSARLDSMNCCLCDISAIMTGGFEMGNLWYNEPNSLDTAFDVMGDIILSCASQQYGGFTVPEVDKVLSPYAQKSYDKYVEEFLEIRGQQTKTMECHEWAMLKVKREFEQGFQGIEYKLNTVGSSRGDYPFITMTFGLATDRFGKLASTTFLEVHKKGQGKEGNKKPVLFPKLVFLYDEELHGEGKPLHDVFEAGIDCSCKTMYPDWLSLTGEGYVASIYKKYKKVISPMGCVDGSEIITYKYKDILYVESFERMWGRITSDIKDRGQSRPSDVHRVVDLRDHNVLIYDTLKGFVKVNYLIRNLQDNWCDVTISNGRKLRTTLDHPFETERGTILAQDLNTDDVVKISTTQYAEESINIDEDLAWLQGFMLCDGCYQNYSVFASIDSDGEEDIEKAFKDSMFKHFNVTPETILQERGEKGTYKDLRIYSNGTNVIKDLISYFTTLFGGVQKKYRHIPNEVFSYNKSARYSFLAGMIDADGYINDNTKKHKYPTVQIGSTNKELALQQLALAQSLGMRARLYTNHYSVNDKTKIRYRVEFFPNKHLIEAMKCEKKKSKWTYFVDDYEDIIYGHITDVEPLDITQYSYDVTTESEHFEVSSVYSHNCRAFLSPYYERGGFEPADENDIPVFVGRFNIGAVSLHLPMILAKARRENRDFYEVLDYYLEMIRQIHCRTYDYLGEMKASISPVMYCEGGFYGGNLQPNQKLKESPTLLPSATASFGFTALNELQELYNGKSIREDGQFALEVLQYINDKIGEFKKQDNHLYAMYGTPAENLCFTGDTLVQTYGGDKQIKDLTTEDLVYSFNEEKHKVELKRVIGSKKTVSNANIVEIKFDNGQTIRCTPNHRFAVRVSNKDTLNGKFIGSEFIEWVEAQNLKNGDRIKSNYIELNKHGRPQCSIYYKGKHQLIQDINAEYTLGEKPLGCVVHHSDEDKENNLFSNLEYLTESDHKRLHMKNTIEKYKYTSESQSGVSNSFYGKHHSEDSKKKNREAHIGNSVEVFDLSMKHLCHYECIGDAERDGFTRHLIKKSCEGNRDHLYKNMYWFYTKDCESLLEQNHKVVSVTYLNYTEDVYDIEVEDNHNFFVGGSQGLLVHNCGLQVEQFRKEFGIVEHVSDRPYVSNSFHCHVTEDMSPIEKQDKEKRFWDLANGGKIQYVRYPLNYNREAVKTLVLRAMKMGFYEGVNLSLAYCDDCGYEQLEMDVCPKCGSRNLTKIDRMNGYLSYSRVKGDTRLNSAKMAEVAERKSM